MNYACENCGFLFTRAGKIEECPFCERKRIRFANKEETQKLQTLLKKRHQILQVKN